MVKPDKKEATKKVSVRLPESIYNQVRKRVADDPELNINDFLVIAIAREAHRPSKANPS